MKKRKKISNFLSRLITGVVYVALILFGIFTDSVAILGVVSFGFTAIACYEFQTITRTNNYTLILKILHSLMAGLIFYTVYTSVSATTDYRDTVIALLPYISYWLYYLIGEMYRNRPDPIREVSFAFFSHLYIAIPMALLMLLCVDHYLVFDVNGTPIRMAHTFWLLPIFTFVWLNDTGAYTVGSLIGKRPLWPRISPKKTVEGAVGGVLAAVLGAFVFHHFFGFVTTLPNWIMLALLVSVFATWGDLFESYIKRACGVKDSGNILPGHGGILDRIDSLLIAAIPAYIFINIIINV